VFNAFAPLIHLGALQSVASQLDLELIGIVAEPFAVARSLDGESLHQAGALFIDVGGGTTDVALVRVGGVDSTRMFALGGRAFTKSLADRLEIPFARAEEVKIDFAKGAPVEQRDEIEAIIAEDVAVWAAGVELVLEEFAREGQLPGRIYLCGGGARLPQLQAALRDAEFARRLPFARPPQVEQMSPQQVAGIADTTGLLVDEQDVTPMGLARQAIEMSADQPPLDAALQRVIRGLKL
jgi:cell division protein FtsA